MLAVHDRALSAVRAVMARAEVRRALDALYTRERRNTLLRDGGVRGLERLEVEIVDLFNAGATEPELRAYAAHPLEVVRDLFVGTARHLRHELEAWFVEAVAAEAMLRGRALVRVLAGRRESAAELAERAAALRFVSASASALAGRLEALARETERNGPDTGPMRVLKVG